MRGVAAGVGKTLLWSVVVLLAQSALWADVPWSLKAVVVSVAALSGWRPQHGLLATAALVPFGNALATHVWSAYTFGLAEAIVLAFLAGALAPWRRRPERRPADAIAWAGVTLAVVIAASIAVQFALERAYQDHWPRFTIDSLRYLAFDYLTAQPDVRPWVVGLGFLPPALLWIEGIGVFFVTRSLCRAVPSLQRNLLVVAVVSSAGASVFTWVRLFDTARAVGASVFAVLNTTDRWNGAIPSLNPSGSYFAMMSLVVLGLAWQARGAIRALGMSAAAIITAAAFVTKSRAAILAWVVMAGAMMARRVIGGWRSAALVTALVATALVVSVQFVNLFDVVRAQSSESMRLRGMLVQGAIGMIEANPAFGVGIRQFRLRFPEYRPPAATAINYAEDDPHNHLLGVGAELGLVGLAAFVCFVGAAMWRAARVMLARPLDAAAVGLFCGVTAFLMTCLSHQPLNVPIAALTFWMLFGAAVARGSGLEVRGSRLTAYATAAAVAAILISVPFRASAAIDRIDFTRIQYGFHDWDTDGHGTKFRWSSDHSTMFLSKEMSLVNLPIGASLGGTPKGVTVRVFVDEQPAGQLFLTDEAWHDVRLVAPRTGRAWRIDLYVSPTFVPMEVNPAILDARRLGVRVGEPVQRELLR